MENGIKTTQHLSASALLRGDEATQDVELNSAATLVDTIVRDLWDNSKFVINAEYKDKLLNGKLFGVRFSADVIGEEAEGIFTAMNLGLLNRDDLSKELEADLIAGDLIDLGDAQVVPHTVIVNPQRDFLSTADAVVGITFNLVLPEDIPEDYDPEEEDEDEDYDN